MKTAKLGALFLVSLMALAGVGAGYAAWTDTITIDGTVNTGKVDVVIEKLSSTYVWKIIDTHGEYYWHGWNDDYLGDPDPGNSILVASAVAEYDDSDPTGDSIIVTANNLFPCTWFMVDFLIHYEGIPARLSVDYDGDGWICDLFDDGYAGFAAYEWDPITQGYVGNPMNLEGYQIHNCEWIYAKLWIHLPQYWPDGTPTDDLMDLDGSFYFDIDAIQWNEYVD